MQKLTLPETAAWLLANDRYRIVTHRRPDGDAVGSACALCLGLRALGKTAAIWDNPQFTPRHAPFLEGLISREPLDGDTVVSVDLAAETLLPLNADALAGRTALAIDHHGSNTHFAERELVLPQAAACGEILYPLLTAMGVSLTRRMAEAIYVAVSTDTGCFQYANTTAQTLQTAADMAKLGADLFVINQQFFGTKTFGRLQLEARLTQTMVFCADGLVGLCQIPAAWVAELGLTEDDLDSISGFARTVEGVEIGILIREVEQGAGKLSLRTSPRFDASALCAQLGGGGHAGAAGATVAEGPEAARQAILQVLHQAGIVPEQEGFHARRHSDR